ncbi:MAG: hypothetical protein HYY76_12110 [Acidobacteria bacterium]|nr:hypothetical protein [Acidobacteriota bacterium]
MEKVPPCGQAGIPEAWVVDLGGHAEDVYREPGSGGYRQHLRVGPVIS